MLLSLLQTRTNVFFLKDRDCATEKVSKKPPESKIGEDLNFPKIGILETFQVRAFVKKNTGKKFS